MITGCLSVAVPYLLEKAHVLPPSVVPDGDVLRVIPHMLTPDSLFLVVFANLVCIVIACLFAMRTRQKLTDMQRQVHLYAWQMQQLLPKEAGQTGMPLAL
jgi:hypothetical protein